MQRIYVGIDPGFSGAIAFLNEGGHVDVFPMPVAGKELDVMQIVCWMEELDRGKDIVYIEKVGAFPGQGVVSMFNFGFNTGMIHGIVRSMSLPFHIVTPQAWKKSILAGTDRTKQASIDYCLRAYPGVSLYKSARSSKYHDGMADAICIAEYARKMYLSS